MGTNNKLLIGSLIYNHNMGKLKDNSGYLLADC